VRSAITLALAVLVGVLAALPVGLTTANAAGPRDDIMPLDQVKAGMKGYGLTVFQGTKPTRFEVEILGILDNFRPNQPLILIRTNHPRLDVAKVVAGMSGSPIYLNDKMIGAYAYGWQFPKEQVAGVTPIANMIADLDRPLPNQLQGWPIHPLPPGKRGKRRKPQASRGVPADDDRRYAGNLMAYDVLEHTKQIASSRRRALSLGRGDDGIQPLSTPLLMGGVPPGALEAARELFSPLGLEPLRVGGGSKPDPNAPKHYSDGGAIGVSLISGDMNASGLGTVTRVEGERLIAFGHPMMSVGVTALPTAVGNIVWFLASAARSFKLGYDVRPLGALVNDRPASIVVDEGVNAPTIPVRVHMRGVIGSMKPTWNFQVAHDKALTPQLFALAIGSALEMTASEQRMSITWKMTSKMKVRGYPEISLEDFGVTDGGMSPRLLFRTTAIAAAGAIINNPWEHAFIERLDVDIEVKYAREVDELRGVELLTPVVQAGEPARLRVTVVPYRGKPKTRTISVPIPESYAGSKVRLTVSPGYLDQTTQAQPESLTELLTNIGEPSFPPRSLIVSFKAQGKGVAFDGQVARDLPPGAMDMLRPRYSSVSPIPFAPKVRHIVPLDDFLTGSDSVTVKVENNLR
jgi:hypothetical protein